ncbi:MAG TPA: ABC transporter permease subunit [Synergistaceae bacterium]|jgi:glycine betaine/proline transport system permease protein|nr:ABC transporter permease subunit [Synergistaceae bacterium]NLL40373.1 ABC transporter permease subunit [Synergistaceae bacterium]HPX03894.1 ABC transporter permease subunit [Synergistaceae bacterium]HQA55047.1 ABC transporter permease subunit [Synergistaceae bacterium]
MEYLFKFPENLRIGNGEAIDIAVKAFSRNHRESLGLIKSAIIASINSINTLLEAIPWPLLILLVAYMGWKVSKKPYVGPMYAAMLFFIGMCGLWENMLETISMVIVAVFLSVIIGFPLGIIVAMSKRISAVVRPVLDLMQTMPAFVYLVPAVILFSPGKTPALIATTIYAVVPMVRMTNLGIVHVDKEMVEAASAFGSTKMQLLSKVQIPQAMPAIMAGLNQTIMMAMSMVVTCALIGANGLGMEILLATNRTEMGKALMPGISIVIVAIILDRLTQGLIKKEASTE